MYHCTATTLYISGRGRNSLSYISFEAEMNDPQVNIETFLFRDITLLKNDVLGAGSYGKVCRAVCDSLPCAAKIIHPTLFDLNDPGADSFMRKFDEECRLLSKVRHPNVVLYLGTYNDPETGLPVLLMELCDNSLTKFLEQSSPGSLPYHTEVNITHDIALALVYLHANQVIHRDLTSNNVLMIAGTRAKVTDFGMSRLASVNPRMTPLTQCPGNLLYMSPEALDEVPSYTKKLDIFSLGVLVVQILTQQFPNPSPRFKVVDVSQDPRFSSKTVNMPVVETERRSHHLELIDDSHPLKDLALKCLKDVEKTRPTALELSSMLEEMKQTQHYRESVESMQIERLEEERNSLSRARINSLRVQVQELKQRDIKQQQKLSYQQREHNLQKKQVLTEMREEIQQLQTAVKEKEQELQEAHETEKALRAIVEARDRELHNCQLTEKKLRALVEVKDRELQNNQRTEMQVQHTLHLKEREIHDLKQTLSTMRQSGTMKLNRSESLPDENVRPSPQDTSNSHITLRFDRNIAAPNAVRRGAAVVYKNAAFVAPEDSNKIYQITKGIDRWNVLPDHPFKNFSLVVFSDGCVTSIGGWNGTTYTNQLLTLTHEQRWVFGLYPAMPTARIEAAVVNSNTKHVLVVAGGYNGQMMLDTVEVLTHYTMQWSTASCLPHPFYMASSTICGDQLYLAGGYSAPDVKSKSVFTCSIVDLIPSSLVDENGVTRARVARSQVWRKAGKLPYGKCTLVSQGGRLLAVGGKDDKGQISAGVLTYDTQTEKWRHVSDLTVARNQCFALAFPGDVVYIIGGEPKNYSIEVMTVIEIRMRL